MALTCFLLEIRWSDVSMYLPRLVSAGTLVPSRMAFPSTEKWYNWPSGSVKTKCSLATKGVVATFVEIGAGGVLLMSPVSRREKGIYIFFSFVSEQKAKDN